MLIPIRSENFPSFTGQEGQGVHFEYYPYSRRDLTNKTQECLKWELNGTMTENYDPKVSSLGN